MTSSRARARVVHAMPIAAAALCFAPALGSQTPPPVSRVVTVATSGWSGPMDQSAHEIHAGPGPRTWHVVLHPRYVQWYRVQAFATGSGRVMAQLTAGGRAIQGPRQLNASGYATDWIICTSPANAPLVLDVRAERAAEWAFGLWIPPVTTPIGPCP